MVEKFDTDLSLTLLLGPGTTSLEVRDPKSRTRFLQISLPDAQVLQLFGRCAEVPVKGKLSHLDRVGKTIETQSIEFELPATPGHPTSMKDHARALVKNFVPDGWLPDLYFGSQDSFTHKDGRTLAKTTIRRWV